MKKTWKKWGWIILWALLSVLSALVIHLLFHESAPCDELVATWSSGEILTYISTVSLGLLALWQTQKLHYDSDKSDFKKTAIDTYVLFDFEEVSCIFFGEDVKDKPATEVKGGFNGSKAFWIPNPLPTKYTKIKLTIKIRNISHFPAISPEATAETNGIYECNVTCGDINDTKYIPANGYGNIHVVLKNDDIPKELTLHFSNPFGITYLQRVYVYFKRSDGMILLDRTVLLNIIDQDKLE